MPYQTKKDARGNIIYVPFFETNPSPIKKRSYNTGHKSITLEMAQKEILKNQHSTDRICKTVRWTTEKQDYYQTCWQIVENYKRTYNRFSDL